MAWCPPVMAHRALRTIVGAVEFAGTNEPAQKRSWFQEPFSAERPPAIGLLCIPDSEARIDGVAQDDLEHVQRFVHGARQVDVPAVEADRVALVSISRGQVRGEPLVGEHRRERIEELVIARIGTARRHLR